MLRTLLQVVFVGVVLLIAAPFYMTSRALDQHGVAISGKVYHKSEYARVRYSTWELARDVSFEYTVPESSSAGFFTLHPNQVRYDALRTGQPVELRYLPRKDLPHVPGADILWQMHASTIVKLADMEGMSRFSNLLTPGVMLGVAIGAGMLVLFILWRITRVSFFGWGVAIGFVPLVALSLISEFPRPTPVPTNDVRHAPGHVVTISHIDNLFSGSHTRGFIADQPVDVVTLEFTPPGRPEAVVAVDLIDRGSVGALRDLSPVTVTYESATPRTARIDGASRTFPQRNFAGSLVEIGAYGAALLVVLAFFALVGRRKSARKL